jgi:hypothetical protein
MEYAPTGRPVDIEVFAGDASDSDASSFKTAVTRVRDDFGTEEIIVVGDHGMITTARPPLPYPRVHQARHGHPHPRRTLPTPPGRLWKPTHGNRSRSEIAEGRP